jgi:hypothetical protein
VTSDSQDSPRPKFGGSHHLPPYNILWTSLREWHPNGFLSRDSQMGVPKSLRPRVPQLCGAITSCADLRSGWGLNRSCSPRRELSNGILHATCTQGNRVDSWLSVVESQTANLTPGLCFGHNLCYRCPNGSCKPILDIYASISFQWYKKLFNMKGFPFVIALWSFGSPPWLQLPTWEFTWECVSSFSRSPTLPGPSLGPCSYKPVLWSQAQG